MGTKITNSAMVYGYPAVNCVVCGKKEAYRFVKHIDGKIDHDYDNVGGRLTLEECKIKCGSGQWSGCRGFSRSMYPGKDNVPWNCYWTASIEHLVYDDDD